MSRATNDLNAVRSYLGRASRTDEYCDACDHKHIDIATTNWKLPGLYSAGACLFTVKESPAN
jgi:hypothetical protein